VRAPVTVAHSLLVNADHLLRDGTTDQDLAPEDFARRDTGQLQRRLIGRPEALRLRIPVAPLRVAGPALIFRRMVGAGVTGPGGQHTAPRPRKVVAHARRTLLRLTGVVQHTLLVRAHRKIARFAPV
jgi:hypothetical protein